MRYDEETKEIIRRMYSEGYNSSELSKKFGIKQGTITSWLRKSKLSRHKGPKSKVLTEDYFEIIDNQKKAYYLGWIMADGNVSVYNGQYALKIHIALQDRELIDSFVKDIGSTNSILVKERDGKQSCYISISSKKMVQDLMKYGIVPNKTGKEIVPELNPSLTRHFIRGFFDGDGIVSYTDKTKVIGFVSNLDMLEQIKNHMNWNCTTNKNKRCKNLGVIKTESNKLIRKIYDYFYSGAEIYLNRKKEKFNRILQDNTEVSNQIAKG